MGGHRAAGLECVAYPALAGIAYCLLCLGVVTWLPALAAVGHALQRWRTEGEARCFAGVFAAFPRYWRALWPHAVVSTTVVAVLATNLLFLAGRTEPLAIPLIDVSARYVRVVGHGDTQNDWTSITEVDIYDAGSPGGGRRV